MWRAGIGFGFWVQIGFRKSSDFTGWGNLQDYGTGSSHNPDEGFDAA